MNDFYERLARLEKNNVTFVTVTVVARTGHCPQVPGAMMCVTLADGIFGTVGGGTIEYLAIEEAKKLAMNHGDPFTKEYLLGEDEKPIDAVRTGMLCGGRATLFFDIHGCRENLYVFGAGHVGRALWNIVRTLDFCTTIFDSRKEMAEGFDEANLVITDYAEAFDGTDFRSNSYFVIATHSHEIDYQILKKIYQRELNPRYVGVIASRKKCDSIMQRLIAECGRKQPFLEKLYCPIGLNIGGPSPSEISVSVAAELQAVKYGKQGGHLTKHWVGLE